MKKEKILLSIENLKDIEKYKKIGINNFLFAVNEFSIGYNSFELEEIKKIDCKKFLLINRIFNNNDVDNFKVFINKLDGINGIIFEDISVYNILKNKNIPLIWNQNHFATNYSSINYILNMVDSAIISNELTLEEVNMILNKSNKNLVLNVFGKNPIMYSRRTLLSNFNNNFKLNEIKETILKETITDNEFLVKEDTKGTIFFNNKYFNLIPKLDEFYNEKILYYLINTHELDFNVINDVINNKTNLIYDDGFMNRKTIYKLGDKK